MFPVSEGLCLKSKFDTIYGSAHEISALITSSLNLLNMYMQLNNGTRGLIFGLSLHLHVYPYFV